LTLVVAAIVAINVLPIQHVERSRLARLAVTAPPPGFKAKPSVEIVPANSNPFPGVTTASKRSPNATGQFSVEWPGSSSANDAATILVSLLPSTSQAKAVQSEAIKNNLGAASYAAESYGHQVPFAVSEVPGAEAATYSPTSSNSAPQLGVVVERVDRVVVLGLVRQTGAATQVKSTSSSVAQAEYRHLLPIVSGFSLVRTHWPLLALLIYGAASLLLAALAIAIPPLTGRVRRKRRAAQEVAARRLVLQRGGKLAKRQAHHRR